MTTTLVGTWNCRVYTVCTAYTVHIHFYILYVLVELFIYLVLM